MSDETNEAETIGGLGALQTDVLAGTTHKASDIRMVGRAVREGWEIPAPKRVEITNRMIEIVEKREVTVMTKDGPESLDGPADSNAIGATRVLVAMDAQNQVDFWNQDKNERLDTGKATENVAFRPAPTNDVPLPAHITKRLTGPG